MARLRAYGCAQAPLLCPVRPELSSEDVSPYVTSRRHPALPFANLVQCAGCGFGATLQSQDFCQASNSSRVMPANVMISEREITVRFQKRAHNPLLTAAGFHETDLPVPWIGRKRLQLVFG